MRHTRTRRRARALEHARTQHAVIGLSDFVASFTRYAAYVQDCVSILEIGGHRNPISEFISGPEILVVDPFTYSAYRNHTGSGHVRHLKASWESAMNATKTMDCLVLLGSSSADSSVIDLVGRSRKVVFEIARHNLAVLTQWKGALPGLLQTFRLVAHLNLTIPSGPDSDASDAVPVPRFQGDRELWVLESKHRLNHRMEY